MRPLEKGPCPQVGAVDKVVTDYKSWRKDLIDRIGHYCAYCNMPLSYNLQVEHVIAKVPVPGAPVGSMFDWDNMLLACGPCNLTKSNKPSNGTLHYLPEVHNTHLPFIAAIHANYLDAAVVNARAGLNAVQQSKATDTIELFGLASVDKKDKVTDIRWMKRRLAMECVDALYSLLMEAKGNPSYNAKHVAPMVARTAAAVGFFSLWYEKFNNEPEIMEALTDNSVILGTASSCFDKTNGFKPIARNPGNAADPI